MRVGIYGGSFDPPHAAHLLAVTYGLSVCGLDRVLVVPVFSHAFEKRLVAFEHRVKMCELGLGWLPGAEICRVEETLPQPNYTLYTVRRLKELYPDAELSLMIGSDVLVDSPKWHAFDEIVTLAPPTILGRVGYPHPAAPMPVLPELSSSQVRALLTQDDPTTRAKLASLVPQPVREYIEAQGLYR